MTSTNAPIHSPQRKRVFIVDDHPVFCRGLRLVIEDEPDLTVCGEAATIADALSALRSTDAHIVLVDISLKDGNGLDLIRHVKAVSPDLPTLVMSAHPESRYAEPALRAGARGYIEKQANIGAVIEAIRKVLSGGVYLSARMMERVLAQFVTKGVTAQNSPSERLTARELAVFELIGRGMRTVEIASQLRCSPKTIQVYRDHIREKLGLEDGVALQHAAFLWLHLEMEKPD